MLHVLVIHLFPGASTNTVRKVGGDSVITSEEVKVGIRIDLKDHLFGILPLVTRPGICVRVVILFQQVGVIVPLEHLEIRLVGVSVNLRKVIEEVGINISNVALGAELADLPRIVLILDRDLNPVQLIISLQGSVTVILTLVSTVVGLHGIISANDVRFMNSDSTIARGSLQIVSSIGGLATSFY